MFGCCCFCLPPPLLAWEGRELKTTAMCMYCALFLPVLSGKAASTDGFWSVRVSNNFHQIFASTLRAHFMSLFWKRLRLPIIVLNLELSLQVFLYLFWILYTFHYFVYLSERLSDLTDVLFSIRIMCSVHILSRKIINAVYPSLLFL